MSDQGMTDKQDETITYAVGGACDTFTTNHALMDPRGVGLRYCDRCGEFEFRHLLRRQREALPVVRLQEMASQLDAVFWCLSPTNGVARRTVRVMAEELKAAAAALSTPSADPEVKS